MTAIKKPTAAAAKKPVAKPLPKSAPPALKPFKVGDKVRVTRSGEVGRYMGISTSLRGNFCMLNFAEPRKPADKRKFRRSALELAS